VSDEILTQINEKLEQLVRLTAANSVKGMKQADAIVVLGAAGLDRNLIAMLLGTTPNTVSVRLSQVKAASKGTSDKKKKTAEPAASALSEEQA